MTSRTINWTITACLAIVFIFDCSGVWGVPFSRFYLLGILLISQTNHVKTPYVLATASTVLTFVAQAVPLSVVPRQTSILSCFIDVVLFWIAAAFVSRSNRSALDRSNQLTTEVEQKQTELRIEKALRESESKYRAFVDHASDAIFVYDDKGVVIDVNRRACESLGYARQELIGKSPPFFAKHSSPEFLSEIVEKLHAGEKVVFDSIYRHRETGEFPVEVHVSPFQINGSGFALSVARNITDRKQAEDNLRKSEQRFRELADGIPQIVWTAAPDGAITHLNSRAMQYTGASIDELKGWLWGNFIHPDDVPQSIESWMGTIKSGIPRDVELRFRRHDGEYRWHICRQFPSQNPDGSIALWYGTCTDIEVQKRIESALRDSEQQLERQRNELNLIFDTVPALIFYKNTKHVLIRVNEETVRVLGRPRDQIEGKTSKDAGSPYAEKYELDENEIISTGVPKLGMIEPIYTKTGTRWLRTDKIPTRDESGKITGVLGFSIDITERRQAEFAISGQNRVMERIAVGAPLGEILEQIVELIEDQLPEAICSILLFDAEENRLRFGAGKRLPTAYSEAIDGILAGPCAGSCGTAVFRRESVVVSDISTNPLWVDYCDLALGHELRSCWSVPIFSRTVNNDHIPNQRVLGTFAIYGQKPWEPGPDAAQIVGTATYLAGIAIERDADIRSLRESEANLANAQQIAHLGSWVWDLTTDRMNASDEVFRLFGIAPQEIEPTFELFLDAVHSDDRAFVQSAVERAITEKSSYDIEYRIIRLNGEQRIVHAQGEFVFDIQRNPIRFAGVIMDITERKQAEEKLHATEKHLAMLFRSIPVGVCITTMEEGRMLEANDACIEIAGFSREDVMGTRTVDFGQWLDPTRRDQLVKELKLRGSVKNWEVPFRRRDGSIGYALKTFERITVNGMDCILTIVSDISERKQIDEELRSNRQRLEVLSRQLITTQETERRHLARELHDEIGQVLTAIKMNLRRTQRNADSAVQSYLEENVSMVEHAIGQVRNLSLSLRPPQLDQLGLVAALHWVVSYQSRIGGFPILLEADIGDLVVSDEIAIVCFRITQESLTNAVRHADPRNVQVQLQRIQGELYLRIQDDGNGFDVVQARDDATLGASLGLLSMEERVSLTGGRLMIESSVGCGTSIQAWFPLKMTEYHVVPT